MAIKYNLPQTATMINKLIRYQELFLFTDKSTEEVTEMNQLQQELIDYMITPNDFNSKVDNNDYSKVSTYKTTGGTSTAYTITLDEIIDNITAGQGWLIQTHVDSGINPTLKISNASAKPILKPNGNPAKLYKDSIYHVRYNGSNFILLGEGGEYGTAQAQHVLENYTIGTENGIVAGTMLDNGGINEIITTLNGQFTIPAGYHNGSGKVSTQITPQLAMIEFNDDDVGVENLGNLRFKCTYPSKPVMIIVTRLSMTYPALTLTYPEWIMNPYSGQLLGRRIAADEEDYIEMYLETITDTYMILDINNTGSFSNFKVECYYLID